jgi:AhpD family alkylhydroperoxidase
MTELTRRERELVALGAAMGCNCAPCVEHHIPEARKAGLTDSQIRAAIELADKVRQVPARKVLDAAMSALGGDSGIGESGANEAAQCAEISNAGSKNCC